MGTFLVSISSEGRCFEAPSRQAEVAFNYLVDRKEASRTQVIHHDLPVSGASPRLRGGE